MQHLHNTGIPFLHFSFLRDIKVHGVYYNSFRRYLNEYPIAKKEHLHDFYTILLLTEGNGTLRIKNDSYKVQPQTICLIAPEQVHSYDGIEDMEGIIFFFCQDFYVEEFSFLRLLNIFSCTSQIKNDTCKPCIYLSENEYAEACDLLRSIYNEYDGSLAQNNPGLIIRSLVNILLLKLTKFQESKPEEINQGDSIFIHKLSHMVDSYFIFEHNTGFYASAFNISEKHLNDICNRHFNCSLKKILTDRLMQEARKLLLSTELSVSEISYKLNFEDNSYFVKVFKKQTSLTPKRFRDIHKRLLP